MANFIHDIEIKNFKSIRQAKIEDCRRVNVFIGYPHVGKSNILEALSGYSLLNTKSLTNLSLKRLIRFSGLTDLFYNRNATQPATVRINDEDDLVYELTDLQNLSLFISSLSKKSKINDKNIALKRGEIYLKSNISSDGNFSFIQGIELEQTGKVLVKKYSFQSGTKFKSSISLNLNIPNGENLNDIIEVNPELRKECNSLLKEYDLNLNFNRTKEGNQLELRKNIGDGTTMTLDWELIADTLQRLFFYKAAIASNSNSVLLFEEPEVHMFPPYISKFTSDVMFDKNYNQFFIATHSPFILNDFMEDLEGEDLAIYAVGYSNGETTINRLTDKQVTDVYQYGVDLFFNLEEFLRDVVS